MTRKERKKENNCYMQTAEQATHNWIILDAEGKTLGRFASEVAKLLRGKHKPTFTPHTDAGDGVIVLNAEKIHVTGSKEAQIVFRHHTGFVGGLREIPYRVMLERNPEFIIESVVKGMMPKTKQGNAQLKRLRVFAGSEHNLQAQKPIRANI